MTTSYKLYLDDLRMPSSNDFVIVRSVQEAINCITLNGMPNFISFDHDLGADDFDGLQQSGYDFAKWLVEADIAGKINIPKDFSFAVHSQNPVGAKNIKMLLKNYLEFKF